MGIAEDMLSEAEFVQTEQVSSLQVERVAYDLSGTFVQTCEPSSPTGDPPVYGLETPLARMEMSGLAQQINDGATRSFIVFPGVDRALSGVLTREGRAVASLEWAGDPQGDCQQPELEEAGPTRLVACGALLSATWDVPLPGPIQDVDLVDVDVWDDQPGGAQGAAHLGFFLYDAVPSATGLSLHFAFRRPQGRHVVLEMNDIILADGTHPQVGSPPPSSSILLPVELTATPS